MMDGPMMGWFWIWPVPVVIGLALPAYLALRLTRSRGPGSAVDVATGASSARQILDERYARGEIDHEEYRERRTELT